MKNARKEQGREVHFTEGVSDDLIYGLCTTIYIVDINEQAKAMFFRRVKEYADRQGVTE